MTALTCLAIVLAIGAAMVLDGGCAEGYIDFYTNW